ncbi:MAG: SGNH/GDSL hydrolase family protein [Bryobacteraceae bacterium]
MRTILCYGDSNTWGFIPGTGRRYEREVRWPGVLRRELGVQFDVIEAGLNGRTTVWTDPLLEYRNGKNLLPAWLDTHKPIDLVITMLGLNDLKHKYAASAYDIARGAALLVDMIRKSAAGPDDGPPEALLICPAPVGRLTTFAEMFAGAEEKSRRLPAHYSAVAEETGCHFLDAGEIVRYSDADGLHLSPEEHAKLGCAVAQAVHRIFTAPAA